MIASRRAKVDDQNRDKLPDSPRSDPREVLDYLQRYSGRDIPRWVLQADVCDALTLNNWLWWEDRRRELQALAPPTPRHAGDRAPGHAMRRAGSSDAADAILEPSAP